MLGARDNSAATELPDGSFWILGGSGSDADSTEIFANGSFRRGPRIDDLFPSTDGRLCATPISDTETFVITSFAAAVYDWSGGSLEILDPEEVDFLGYLCQCGTFSGADGSGRQLVLTGEKLFR